LLPAACWAQTPSTFPRNHGPAVFSSIDSVVQVDGVKFTQNGAGIAAAIASLPSCTVPSFGGSWNHCGTVFLPAGSYTIPSQISVTSPMVHVKGAGSIATYLNYTGTTGCAFVWTSTPFNTGGEDSNELEDLTIDGSGASAGTCGVHYYDIDAFTANRIDIRFFKGTGSAALWTDAISQFSERGKVQAQLYDNTIGWHITNNVSSASSAVTFGYANYDLWLNCNMGETCVLQENGSGAGAGSYPFLSYANMHLLINGDNGTETAISILKGIWSTNLYDIHMEGTSTGINLAAGVVISGIGNIQENIGATDVIGSNAFIMTTTTRLDTVNGVDNLVVGDITECSTSTPVYSVTVCGRLGTKPFQLDYGKAHIFGFDTDGTLLPSGNGVTSRANGNAFEGLFDIHNITAARTWTQPDASGTSSLAAVEYCGATSGGTQACAKTVQALPLIVWGDVTLNTATSQSITTLPFTDGLYSCSGSDLTTAAGIVSFNTYAAASVTIAESGGMNTDHLRYQCVGH